MARQVESLQEGTPRPAGRGGGHSGGGAPAAGRPTVPAAARAMALFEVFAREQRELTKSEVARLLDLAESSSSDLLNTLYELGYVSRTATSKRFYPTGRLLAVASMIAANDGLAAFGNEATSLLAQRSGETSCCAVLAGEQIKVVAVSEGRHRLRYMLNVGDFFSVHGTSIGKALLGELDDETMGRLLRLKPLAQLTPKTIVEPRAFEAEIRKHRELGWYRASDEGTTGVSSFAVAGRIGDQPVGLSLIGPTGRVAARPDQMRDIILEVRGAVFDG
ncbi:IclR family transcriptional regulator C-terminal domain-containing protein [Pseudofrankia sp. DC12]|uniref:IclR family transcriptional regulator n=1 Tax=Pseudofrankia sp. DC12 TaxID=683315 RepID=UPI0018DE301F|nr:IclR family transcriptional regulator C-terminal domain-containing protein [Pseudofrankia sp. DC12]